MYELIINDIKTILIKLESQYKIYKRDFFASDNKKEKEAIKEETYKLKRVHDAVEKDFENYKFVYNRLYQLQGTEKYTEYKNKVLDYEKRIYNKYHIENGKIINIPYKQLISFLIASGITVTSITALVSSINTKGDSAVANMSNSSSIQESNSNDVTVDYSLNNINDFYYQNIKYNTDTLIYVTQGNESNSRGTPYPLEQYVEGVLTGEHVVQSYYKLYLEGEVTENELIESLKSFAIIARSYGLYQTVFSSRHENDHKIQASSVKQCFSKEYLDDNGIVALLARLAAQSTAGMTLTVDGLPLNARYDSFTSSGAIKNGCYVGYYKILDRKGNEIDTQELYVPTSWVNINSKLRNGHRFGASQYAILALSKEGLDYTEIAKHFYTKEATINYFNYGTNTFGSEVYNYNNFL